MGLLEVDMNAINPNTKPETKLLPLLLAPDNFTPRSRTPWAGQEIHARYKKNHSTEAWIGESWEISCDPDFPSQIVDAKGNPTGKTLQETISENPAAMISPQLAREWGREASCPILVKLVNASSPLSVQVHPTDDDLALKPNECGKPESWLILHAKPNAGIYIGLKRPWDKDSLRDALTTGKFSADDLQFVPVQEGDYFELTPGILHAIGPGTTILEPQRIKFGKGGKTYRVWDWNRRYNAHGYEDPLAGTPRELHVNEALTVFDPATQYGHEFAQSTKRTASRSHPAKGVNVLTFPTNENYAVRRIQMLPGATCHLKVLGGQGFATITVLDGSLNLGAVRIPVGQSAFVPWAALPASLESSLGADFALISHAALDIAVTP